MRYIFDSSAPYTKKYETRIGFVEVVCEEGDE